VIESIFSQYFDFFYYSPPLKATDVAVIIFNVSVVCVTKSVFFQDYISFKKGPPPGADWAGLEVGKSRPGPRGGYPLGPTRGPEKRGEG